jgi:EAL domain-containing protein (putative c-di-GMP-specific phosphodiesterase class I)/GGDEF domain-containing protein
MTKSLNESARMRALLDLHLLDTAPSESFDRITRMASQIFDVPIAAVSLTDEDRQWFKSRVGGGPEIPRLKAPCAEVTRIGDVLVVSDMSKDSRFQGGILDRQGMRFYAGAPLTTKDGFTLGAMCVIDNKPRTLSQDEANILTDLAAMVMAQIELQHSLGRIDPASGLPNRYQFTEDLDDMARDAKGEERVAFLIDLIGPMPLRDAMRVYGPSHLDTLVKGAVNEARARLRPEATLYHVGATQFASIIKGTTARELQASVEGHFQDLVVALGPERLKPEPVVGIMPFQLGEASGAQVLRGAHAAAHDARESGLLVAIYSQSIDETHRRRISLVEAMGPALTKAGALSLVYQPRIDLRTGHCDTAEALLRWSDPALGQVSPGEFIPVIEMTDLARPLTHWVIEHALAQARQWRSIDLNLRIAVNVSPANLEEQDFAERLAAALDRHGLTGEAIEIEFTESALIRNKTMILDNLHRIRELGVVCAIDDFGTGYSSFAYLKDIPAQIIKIDQAFIKDLVDGGQESTLVRGMIAMVQGLGLRVVAEGVETQTALDVLRAAHCDEAQGYLIARPLTPKAFEDWIVSHRNGTSAAA